MFQSVEQWKQSAPLCCHVCLHFNLSKVCRSFLRELRDRCYVPTLWSPSAEPDTLLSILSKNRSYCQGSRGRPAVQRVTSPFSFAIGTLRSPGRSVPYPRVQVLRTQDTPDQLKRLHKVVISPEGKTCMGRLGGNLLPAVWRLRTFEPDPQPLLPSVALRCEMRETEQSQTEAGSRG